MVRHLAVFAFAAGAAGLAASGCATHDAQAPVRADIEAVELARGADGGYVATWTASPAGAPVNVYVSADPDAALDAMTLISAEDLDGAHSFAFDDARAYVLVANLEGEGLRAGERVLALEGGRNFRDLGGYATADGRHVRWGTVYRSGAMHELTLADYDYLADLGIGVVCDFRSTEEREREPTAWAAGDVDYVAWDYALDMSGFGELFAGEMSAERTRATMLAFYGDIAYQQADHYTVMFDRLAAGETPLAFNCSAGKDRTGMAAALLLTALGVPRETVLADYALSEQVVDYMADFRDEAAADPDSPYAFLAQLPAEVVAPLMRSDPAYLEAALARLEADHGSVMSFIQDELDVTDEELARIREGLLAP